MYCLGAPAKCERDGDYNDSCSNSDETVWHLTSSGRAPTGAGNIDVGTESRRSQQAKHTGNRCEFMPLPSRRLHRQTRRLLKLSSRHRRMRLLEVDNGPLDLTCELASPGRRWGGRNDDGHVRHGLIPRLRRL